MDLDTRTTNAPRPGRCGCCATRYRAGDRVVYDETLRALVLPEHETSVTR